MSPTASLWLWVGWIVIGLMMGLYGGKILGGKRNTVLDIILSILGSCAGGFGSWSSNYFPTPQLIITSMLVALFVGGIVLWIYDTLIIRFRH